MKVRLLHRGKLVDMAKKEKTKKSVKILCMAMAGTLENNITESNYFLMFWFGS